MIVANDRTQMIVLENISKAYDRDSLAPAVAGVSLQVSPGEALALLGPSGSGKSTLLRLIAGLETPDTGRIWLDGALASEPGWALSPHRRGVGMVFQRPALWPHLTVAQNILFGLGGWPRSDADARLAEVVRLVRIGGLERRYPHQVSGGEGQRVALARAVAPRPPILLLDEPLSGLDPELHGQMLDLINAIRQERPVTMVYVTHHASEAAAVTDRVARLRHGRLESVGSWQATGASGDAVGS
jgi:iron(III) transport system ATP-binding protein